MKKKNTVKRLALWTCATTIATVGTTTTVAQTAGRDSDDGMLSRDHVPQVATGVIDNDDVPVGDGQELLVERGAKGDVAVSITEAGVVSAACNKSQDPTIAHVLPSPGWGYAIDDAGRKIIITFESQTDGDSAVKVMASCNNLGPDVFDLVQES